MAGSNFRFGPDLPRSDELSLDTMQRVNELRAEIRSLRAVLLHVVSCMAQGQQVAVHEEPIRHWLGLPEGVTPEQAIERLVRTQARVLGNVRCPSCGAVVPDREGVHDERCIWCGATVETEL
jgi:hypothetical protein